MCIFDELGILLCTHTAEEYVFANRLSEQEALISFYSISVFYLHNAALMLNELMSFFGGLIIFCLLYALMIVMFNITAIITTFGFCVSVSLSDVIF